MISFLRGQIINKTLNYIILDVNNIGYRVFTSKNFLNDLKIGQELEVYTHHQIKEDTSDLYGFRSLSDLELFELLLSVSGVGPKSALGVLNIASVDDIKEAIVRGDADLLTKVSGIGKKTAARLVLELKNKVLSDRDGSVTTDFLSSNSDEIDALMSLGYSLTVARESLNKVDSKISDSGQRVKEALRRIGK